MFDDADLDAAVDGAAFGAFANSGQICMSTERIIVDAKVADQEPSWWLEEAFRGRPMSGLPAEGDTFTLATSTNGIGDNRNILAMAALQNTNTLNNGTTTFQSAYGQLVGTIGAKTHELQVTSDAQNTMVTQSTAAQQAISGVNLDEEASKLLQYQQSYQAAAKYLQTAQSTFDTLLGIFR